MESRRRRQPALAPDDRRAALIAATIPLLHEHGTEVSTRQIAHAAGVAEGTIFGVFDNKTQLVVCSMVQALDPQPTLDAIAAIDPAADLRARLTQAAEIVHARFAENAHLMHAARKLIFMSDAHPEAAKQMASTRGDLLAAVTVLIEPDAARLRIPAAKAARLLMLHCGASTFGPFGGDEAFSGDELASLLLDGILQSHTGEQVTC
ncbi:TetR/AcrR family transcriptional regulator [Actinoplanes awajinensis]|uniref:TetR family transcriptional regulator n=1 Tax=Actinoplanes awajinensis subsp. mycoplanecinus TaxID=135947 RepID=A0A0X3VFT2_9ACTN|nr:TetR/AcrR family transcriptional regulator [Actinoplanes awajinensis]KUL42256.1 TetR family transcriptional regulator [Actinoplanes awajinensis subsp. mycoplanecinus]